MVAFAAFALFSSPFARGQEASAAEKGTADIELWGAGIVAQHDSETSFDTQAFVGGGSFGRILTAPHGPAWLRGTLEWQFGAGPIVVFSPTQTAYGAELDPIIGRWNFIGKRATRPYFEMAGGMAFTNVNVPPGDTASINVSVKTGVGWEIPLTSRRAFDVGLFAWHLSNAWTGRSNPSANGLQLAFGYHWWLDSAAHTERAAARANGSAQAISQPGQDAPDVASTSPGKTQTSQSAAAGNLADPAPTVTGMPGMFTVETADVLGTGEIAANTYLNKFARAPGSASILGEGVALSAGLTKRISVFAQFEPYEHLHVDEPSQLSLNEPAGCPHGVFDAPIYCVAPVQPGPAPTKPLPPQSSWKGPAAAYMQGFPFAARNTSDYGPVTAGFKVNFWSETRNDPLSVSVRAALVIPTESAAAELARNGAQTGTLDYSFALGLSKTVRHGIVLAANVTYVATGNPKANGETLLTPPDQVIFGQGFIIPIRRHLQLLTEYTATFFQEGHAFGLVGIDTQNTVRGPSLPVDGVWGVRWTLRNATALDLGYRYMLNLHQVHDRNGFIFQVSNIFHRATSD